MNLVIDVGNTRVKTALFEGVKLQSHNIFLKEEILAKLKTLSRNHKIDYAIISSVALISEEKLNEIEKLFHLIRLSYKLKLPFKNKYKTPETLGADRIALIGAAMQNYSSNSVLVIDAGTCITFDFVNRKKEYYGGAISPGVEMRYKAINTFTTNLPLLELDYPKKLIGNSTENSIHSGIINGVLSEIEGVIERYKEFDEKLTVVLTGGDTNFLAKRLKNGIFANPNFLLEGLNYILNYNIKND
ncbi:MAG: type III pantothenate kinase [Urechidicola sp.]|jgi:type III pantothenate kinase|tara:strand:+ start:147 stop:878 length:732 start_codon:yes stop_codon:yes gene_type:complete